MSKIKWVLRLRVKRNRNRIQLLGGFLRDIKSRLENIETNFNMRGEGLDHWLQKITALEEKVEKLMELSAEYHKIDRDVIYNYADKVEALESDNKLIWGNMNDLEKKLEDKQ